MMNRITPVVKQLLIINVVIWVGLQLLTSASPQGYEIYNRYFSLHKTNLLGFQTEVNIEGQTYLLPSRIQLTNGEVITSENAQQVIGRSPSLREQIQQNLRPKSQGFQPLQVVTYFFSHSLRSFTHILFNMLALFFLGPILETVLGPKRFLRFYLFCGVFSGIVLAIFDPSPASVVGASTAVSGVLVAFAMMFPRQKLYLMLLPFGFEARWFALGYGILSLVLSIATYFEPTAGGGISHFGHLAGMIGAVLYFYIEQFLPQGSNPR